MNKIFRLSIPLGTVVLVLVSVLLLVEDSAALYEPGKAPIDPNVYVTLEQQGRAQVQVVLQEQADLSGAVRLKDKADKGAFVYEQLTSTARQAQGSLRAMLDARGVEYKAYWIVNMLIVTVDDQLLEELARQTEVERIESYIEPVSERPGLSGYDLGPGYGLEFGPNPEETTRTGRSLGIYGREFGPVSPATVEWNIQRVGAVDVWNLGFTGEGVVVGSLDTGVEYTHTALVNQYRGNLGGDNFDHNYNWFDGVDGSPSPVDYSFHGTYTMGPILGDDSEYDIQIGMAPGAKWIACPGYGSPNINPLDCYQWFLAPTDLNGNDPRPDLAPDVINQTSFSTADYHSAIQALVSSGIYISQPAGNSGPQCRTLDLPVNQWPEVASVAAFDNTDQITDFSSRGPAMVGHDLIIKPDIAAPGLNVRTSLPVGWGSYTDEGYGTSLAAPHVSGAVALLISAVPELRGRVDLIDMLLKTNAEHQSSTECTPNGGVPNNVWGWGILNIYNAVLAAQTLELGAIEGSVVDAGTQEPIADVQLTFTDTTLSWPYQETSGNLGDYEHILPVGSYDITARHYGYLDSLIGGVEISAGVTTTQDIEMSPAFLWTVSGVVTDSQTGEPLPASIVLESTPVSTGTDPETGEYTAQAAQGEWWLVVTSPGYAEEAIKITLDQDLVQNFSLDPIANYYMRRSVDGECGAQFNWIDITDVIPLAVGWMTYQDVDLPPGRTFNFYGITYTEISINAHGVVTFGSGYADPSGPIPNPNLPNNGIYAFSNWLNPGIYWGGGGSVYADFIDERYFVIEWFEVAHWASRDPETFEIILDLDTNRIKIQYLTVNDPTGVIAGVENSTGTEATLYAYGDPGLITDSTAVEFYPWFGAQPPSGGAGELLGTVTDGSTGLPIEGALVTAEAYTTEDIFSSTTDITGTYKASLCADWYDVTAEADGYEPGVEVQVAVYPDLQTVQDFALTAHTPPEEITITGSTEGTIYTSYTFTATTEPVSTTLPLEYVWQASGQDTITHTSGITDVVSFTWELPGTQQVTVTASNDSGSVMDTHAIDINDVPISGTAAFNDSPMLLGEVTTLSATVEAGTNVVYTWDFGDGELATGQVVTHTYTAAGVYTAVVTATNSTDSQIAITLVTIIAPTYQTYLPLLFKTSDTPPAPAVPMGGEEGMLLGLVLLGGIWGWRRKK